MPAQDYLYETNSGTLTLTAYIGPDVAVTIPSTIDGLSVTSIGDYAFQYRGITSVTNIGEYAFEYCYSLINVMIGNGVSVIGSGAFDACTSLASVTMGNSVTGIGGGAFFDCTSLSGVTIPDKVTNIGSSAFYFCTSLTNATIGKSVTNILDMAFYGCTNLISVTIPDSVTSIGDSAFGFCTRLTAITVGATNSFFSSLEGVLFDKSQTTLLQLPGARAGSYTIPKSVTRIGYKAFWYCTRLASATIPNSVTNIGDWAFYFCNSLKAVYFKGNAPGVAGAVFSGGTTVYYLPGTTGWGTTFGGRPAVLWNPKAQTSDASFGVRTNQFGFTITGTPNIPFVIEASTNPASPVWIPLQSCTLTNGSLYLSDPEWTNYLARWYRLRSP